ncbi:ATP-binding protein [Hyphomicrobium zavarzinii]|uniref:ATP-binding protein n=1 Tax=Hyphomicrobium zavarzinii TaxID=48292 RepID=UPI00036CCB8E|nr:ATP-binding protein [Hyphomicrobium zavarzinii]
MTAMPGPVMKGPALSFALVDDYAFSCAPANSRQPLSFEPAALGPQIEFALLAAQGAVPAIQSGLDTVYMRAIGDGPPNRLVALGDHAGTLKLSADPMVGTEWTRLSLHTKRAAVVAGFADRIAAQLSAAIGELASNIYEHSQAPETGIVAYRGTHGLFEFVVADSGVGALATLRTNPNLKDLATDREALPMVLQEGCSRFLDPLRGNGFKDLFRGLANHEGSLRFRSGEAAVLIDGQSPSPLRPKVKPKVRLNGFMASVNCRVAMATPAHG